MSDVTTVQVKTQLEEKIFTQLQALAPGVPAVTLRGIANNVAAEYSTDIVSDVSIGTNQQLNQIPNNIEGTVNPVNLTNANNGPQDIFNNIQHSIQGQFNPGFAEKITSSIVSQLRNNVQPGQLTNLNFNNLNNNLSSLLSPTITSSINTALSGSLQKTFSTGQTISSFLPGVSSFFENNDSDTALEAIDEAFNISTASQALTEARQFSLDSPENNEKLEVLNKGFTDPQANYPTKEYAGIAETNKLATGDVRGTVVQKKNDERMLGAKLPYGESWDQPESPYRGQYPYNKVTQTEQGHIIEVDDTPGSERLHIYHKSGTFVEIDANGSIVKRAKGSSYEIIDRNGKIAIAGSADISVNGACNIFVGNDANIEVEGDVNLTCHNDITAQAGGTLNMSAKEEVNITGGVVNVQAYETFNMKGNVALNLHSSNVIHMHSNADIKIESVTHNQYTDNFYHTSTESVYLKAGTGIFSQSDGSIHAKAGDGIYHEASSDINLLAGGDVHVDGGGNIQLNSGTASGADDSIESELSFIAASSNIGVLAGRKDIADNSLPDPQSLTLADNKSLLLEEETTSTEDYKNHKQVIISSGYATANDIDGTPISIENQTPTSVQGIIVAPDDKLLKVTALPGNFNLSPNFTVEMLSFKAAVSRDTIRAHTNFSYGDLVYNLQAVALNVLEPIKKVYPNMFVTSAFRDPGNAANAVTSQHPKGQAVDIQFKGLPKSEYYTLAIAIAKMIKYDQLLLEYCNYTANPWIHISYSVEKNKNQILTFYNHKKHSEGLTNLA